MDSAAHCSNVYSWGEMRIAGIFFENVGREGVGHWAVKWAGIGPLQTAGLLNENICGLILIRITFLFLFF